MLFDHTILYVVWLQVDLGEPREVYAIITMGRDDIQLRQWVSTYTFMYSTNCVKWSTYKERNKPKVCYSGPFYVRVYYLTQSVLRYIVRTTLLRYMCIANYDEKNSKNLEEVMKVIASVDIVLV